MTYAWRFDVVLEQLPFLLQGLWLTIALTAVSMVAGTTLGLLVAIALGMTSFQALHRVILPQAILRVIPPLATVWVSLFKDTSIVSAIGVTELMYQARYLATDTYRPLEVFSVVAVVYFLITYPQAV